MITSDDLAQLRRYVNRSDEDGSWRIFGTGYPVRVEVLRDSGASFEVLQEIYARWWSPGPVEEDWVHAFQACLCVVHADCKKIVKNGFGS